MRVLFSSGSLALQAIESNGRAKWLTDFLREWVNSSPKFPEPRHAKACAGFLLFGLPMRSHALPSDCYVDSLEALERKRAEEFGQKLSRREISELGNRPIQEVPSHSRASKPAKRSEA